MVGISRRSIVEWTYEGGLKCIIYRVDVNGNLSVINGEHMIVCWKSGCCYINLGGTAEVEFISFCPLLGMEAFFVVYFKMFN